MKLPNSVHRIGRLFTVVYFGTTLLGCSTFQKKMFGTMALVGGGAAAAAYPLTPQGTSPGAHSAYWGAIGAAVAAAASTYIFDPKEEEPEFERDVKWHSSSNSGLRDLGTSMQSEQAEVPFIKSRSLSSLSAFRAGTLIGVPAPEVQVENSRSQGKH